MMDILAEFHLPSRIEPDDYLQGLGHLAQIR